MAAAYKPNDIVFIAMDDSSVQRGCIYCVIETTYIDRVEYMYEVQYAKDKLGLYKQNVIFSKMEDAFK